MGVFKRHEISYQKRLEICFTKIKAKAIAKLQQLGATQRCQLLLWAKSFSNQELHSSTKVLKRRPKISLSKNGL